MYVSVTGLRLRRSWHMPAFFWHTARSVWQARRTPGNLRVGLRRIDGVYHTLTLWENAAAMRRFAYTGAHRRTIEVFPRIATGTTFGYESDTLPTWAEALEVLRRHGRTPAVR